MVLPASDLVFLAYNKAGSSSIEAALRPARSATWEAYARAGHRVLRHSGPWKHMGVSEFERLFARRSRVLGMHRVAVTRNPFDRMVSVYSYQRHSGPDRHPKAAQLSFRDYVLAGGSGSAMTRFSDFARQRDGAWGVDTVLRVESLDADFRALCAARGLDGVDLPHRNRSARPDHRELYDDETRTLVAQHFALDIERFGYTF